MLKSKRFQVVLIGLVAFIGAFSWGNFDTKLPSAANLPGVEQASDLPSPPIPLQLVNPWLKWKTRDGTRAGYSLAAYKAGEVKYVIRHGVADIETKTPITADTRFRIASMTKPITAVAAMILVERGLIDIEDPVSDYIPEFAEARVWTGPGSEPEALKRPVTIYSLLTFTAGIGSPNGASGRPELDQIWRDALSPLTHTAPLEERVRTMAGLPLYNQPGEDWHYASSLTVLARVIEVATEKPFEEVLEEEIFEPLSMTSTGFMPPEGQREDIATLYTHNSDGKLTVRPDPDYTSKGRVSGDGRLVSTLPDYARFALMLANKGTYDGVEVLQSGSVEQMMTIRVIEGVLEDYGIEGVGWGYGLAIVPVGEEATMPARTGDFFWAGVNGTHFWISPEDDTVYIYMTQYRAPEGIDGRPRGAAIPYVTHAIVNQSL